MSDSIDVLLVDEDEEVLELTQTFLEKKSDSLAVQTETDPELAVDRTIDEGFDCVVSDYRMPQMNGLELCAEIHDQSKVPFFLFTAASREEIHDDTLSQGITGYVQKGAGTAHYDELVADIETALD